MQVERQERHLITDQLEAQDKQMQEQEQQMKKFQIMFLKALAAMDTKEAIKKMNPEIEKVMVESGIT